MGKMQKMTPKSKWRRRFEMNKNIIFHFLSICLLYTSYVSNKSLFCKKKLFFSLFETWYRKIGVISSRGHRDFLCDHGSRSWELSTIFFQKNPKYVFKVHFHDLYFKLHISITRIAKVYFWTKENTGFESLLVAWFMVFGVWLWAIKE